MGDETLSVLTDALQSDPSLAKKTAELLAERLTIANRHIESLQYENGSLRGQQRTYASTIESNFDEIHRLKQKVRKFRLASIWFTALALPAWAFVFSSILE